MAPFGGVKRSGVGRMLSDWIFNELSEIKMILFDLSKVKK
jgi:acyl-CoA reductase-like NAD-dependent aldehyde dehydrogenase